MGLWKGLRRHTSALVPLIFPPHPRQRNLVCSLGVRSLLFSVPPGDKPKREMSFPTKKWERRGQCPEHRGWLRWGGGGGETGKGLGGQNSPFVETCTAANKYGCHGKICWASLCSAEVVAGQPFLPHPLPNPSLSPRTLGPREKLNLQSRFLKGNPRVHVKRSQ